MPGMEEEYVPERGGIHYFFWILTVRYNIWTGSYCLEPWERKLFNITMITALLMTVWTAYMFLPGWLTSSLSMLCASTDKILAHAGDMTKSIGDNFH